MALEPQLKRAVFGYRKAEVEEALTQRDDQLHVVVSERNELSGRLNEASVSLLGARRELAEAEERAAATVEWNDHLENELEIAKGRVAALERDVADLDERTAEQRSRAQAAEGRLHDVEVDLTHERERAEAAGAHLVQAQERAAGLEATMQERTRELAKTSDALDGVRVELHSVRAEARSAHEDAEGSRRALEDAGSTIVGLRDDAQKLHQRVEELVEERDHAQREADTQRARAERASQEAAEARESLQIAADTIARGETPVGAGDVAAALEIAERAMERIVDENRRRIAEDIAPLERRRDEARDEVARLEEHAGRLRAAGWRVGEAVRETRDAIGSVDEAIRTALQPLVGSLSVLDEGISVLDVGNLEGSEPDADDDAGPHVSGSDSEPGADEPAVVWSRAREGRAG